MGTVTAERPLTRRRASQSPAPMPQHRRMALLLGGIGTGLVFLSVWHLTSAIMVLTGTPLVLAALLGIGIDCGLCASEVSESVARGDPIVRRWARGYVGLSTILSMVLNSYEFLRGTPDTLAAQVLAVVFGISLPVLYFILFRLAGRMWQGGK